MNLGVEVGASHPRRVEIDMTDAHLWDLTGAGAVDKVVFRYRRQGAEVNLIGMNEATRTLIARVGQHDKTHLPQGGSRTSAQTSAGH
nr:STAS domain-containing protein [Caulobacter sp. RHG1]